MIINVDRISGGRKLRLGQWVDDKRFKGEMWIVHVALEPRPEWVLVEEISMDGVRITVTKRPT